MKTLRLQFVFNACEDWTTIPEKMAAVKAFYAPQFNVQIDVVMTSFVSVPFNQATGTDGSSGKEQVVATSIVDAIWFDEHITEKALGYDMVLFYVKKDAIPTHFYSAGLRGDNDEGPVELQIFGINEKDHCYQYGVDLGNSFAVFACHEIAHGLYLMFGGVDNTHKYFYSTNPAAILNDFNFSDQTFIQGEVSRVKRALAFIQKLIALIKPPMPPQQFPANIITWAKAIKIEEGSKPELNNPGNLKYAPLTASWGCTPGFNATDGGSIGKFPTPQKGMDALCNFLVLGCHDELKAFHNARTLGQFTTVYAKPPAGSHYAVNVAKALGVSVETDISSLI